MKNPKAKNVKIASFFKLFSCVLVSAGISLCYCELLISCESTSSIEKNETVTGNVVKEEKNQTKSEKKPAFSKKEFLNKVKAYVANLEYDFALAEYDNLPENVKTAYELDKDYEMEFLHAEIYVKKGELEPAVKICETLLSSTETPSEQLKEFAYTVKKDQFFPKVKELAKQNKIKEALAEYEMPEVLKALFAEDYEVEYFHARLLNIGGDYDAALEHCERLSKINNTEEIQNLMFSIKKKFFMTKLQEALNQSDEKALALYKDIDPLLAKDFRINLIKASIQVSAKKFNEAKATCDYLDTLNPNTLEVSEIRMLIAEQSGNENLKNQELRKIIAKDPLNETANIQLAESSAVKKNYKQAKIYYANAYKKNPKNEDALFGMGQMDYYLENDENAKREFQKLLEINPQNPQAYSYLGKLAFANDEYKTACDYVEKAIEIIPENYDYWVDYGQYLRYMGRFAEAEKAWSKAIEIDGNYFLAYAYRAGIYDEQDKIKEALADYSTVVKLNPKYYYAYESIGILSLHEKRWEDAGKAFFECRKNNLENISYPLMVTYCYYMLSNEAKASAEKYTALSKEAYAAEKTDQAKSYEAKAKEFNIQAKGLSDKAKKYSNDVLRKMGNINSMDYKMLRVFHDQNGYQNLPQQIAVMTNVNQRGKMYFYLGLLYDMFGVRNSANEFYAKVISMNSPMFFEYRLAEWAVKEGLHADEKK